MALVIVGHCGGAAFLQRQARLGPVQRLYLGLFVDAQHDGPLWRIEVKPDDICDFLFEGWVVRDLETFRQMRLQTGIRPDTADTRRRDANRLSHQRTRPVRGIGRAVLHRLRNHLEPRLPRQRRHP